MSGSLADTIVLGGGIAGLVCAVRLAELGCTPLVVERGEGAYPCNARWSGGIFHVCFNDPMAPTEVLKKAILNANPEADPALAGAVAEDAGRLIRWMEGQGIDFAPSGDLAWRRWSLVPAGLSRTGLHWEGRGSDVMMHTLRQRLEQLGGRGRAGTRGLDLIVRQGRCEGLVVERAGRREDLAARAVVLADGGFQGNAEMVRQYVTQRPDRVRQRGAGTGIGDGIRMAAAAGARLTRMDMIYGHVLCRNAMSSDDLWPYPIVDYLAASGIVVDARGDRFMDEGLGGVSMTNGIARLDDPSSATAIFDEAIWQGPAREFILPANPNLRNAGGTMLEAGELGALARLAGLPAERLSVTVSAYNAAVDAGTTARLAPARSSGAYKAWPIRVPPFYAVPLAAGMTYTMGGIATDADGRALTVAGPPLPGLYAAGSTTGGLEGGDTAGYVSGLTKSGVFGLRAAEAVAAFLRARA